MGARCDCRRRVVEERRGEEESGLCGHCSAACVGQLAAGEKGERESTAATDVPTLRKMSTESDSNIQDRLYMEKSI